MDQEKLNKVKEEMEKLKAKGYSQEELDKILGQTIRMGSSGKSKKEILGQIIQDKLEQEGY